MRNNRVNLRLTDEELKEVDKRRGNNTRNGFFRNLAFGNSKTSYLVLDRVGNIISGFRLKRNAVADSKHYKDSTVVKAKYD